MELNKALKAVFGERHLADAVTSGEEVAVDAWKGVIDEAWSGNIHRWSSVLDPLNAPKER